MVGNKRGDSFFVTIGPCTWLKSALGDWLENSGEFQQFAIGQESYSEKLDPDTGEVVDGPVGFHQHIYLKSLEKILLVDVREMFILFLGQEVVSIDVQSCKSAIHTLRYLSKEDRSPLLFNVPVSKLSLYARSWHHAKTKYRCIRPIDMADPFIIAAGPHYKMVLNVIDCHLREMRDKINLARFRYDSNPFCRATDQVMGALNGGKHLYLESPPGYGKSEFIDNYLKNKVYFKVNDWNQYCFAGLHESHEFLWFEDFDFEKWKNVSSTILSIMDGKQVSLQAKYLPDRLTSFKLIVIFTSNFVLGATPEYLQRRVEHVYWDHKVFDCLCGMPNDIDDLFSLSLM